ncbi:hypothetical protein LINPERPRIM_LOCUS2628 [Linum perenne]
MGTESTTNERGVLQYATFTCQKCHRMFIWHSEDAFGPITR